MLTAIEAKLAAAGSSPADLERVLNSKEAMRILPAHTRRQALDELANLKRRLRRTVCSEAWFSDCWNGHQSFPPPADTTPMITCTCERCQQSGRRWPDAYHAPFGQTATESPEQHVGDGILSYECYLESLTDWEAAQLPSSPSGLALRAIREGRIKIRNRRTRTGRRH